MRGRDGYSKAARVVRGSKSIVASLLATVVLVVGATACGGGGDEAASDQLAEADFPTGREIPDEPIDLTMWWWGEQEAEGTKAFLDETIALYQEKHPNVTIKPVLQTTEGLVPSFETAAQAGKGPDIQYFWGGAWGLESAWKGYVRPVGDYIPEDEWAHYINSQEDTYEGKLWTMPWYLLPQSPVLFRKDVLARAGVEPPKTWDELLSACDTLNSQGVTPIAGGLKDGWFGGWLYSILGMQNVSTTDVLDAVSGEQSFAEEPHSVWWERLEELRENQCFNEDINSLALYQGQQRWTDGKAAMTIVSGAAVPTFVEAAGAENVGIMNIPAWSDGPHAGRLGQASQTLGITATTQYPQVAADFLMFMHTPERMRAFFERTGAIPADDRFDAKLIELPQQQYLFEEAQVEWAPYLEDFIPTELDTKAMFGQSQLVMQGESSAADAAEATEQLMQRLRVTQPDRIDNFATWAETFR
jgi:raffinose/stachyose/melibiose transport system substrate-binding protein